MAAEPTVVINVLGKLEELRAAAQAQAEQARQPKPHGILIDSIKQAASFDALSGATGHKTSVGGSISVGVGGFGQLKESLTKRLLETSIRHQMEDAAKSRAAMAMAVSSSGSSSAAVAGRMFKMAASQAYNPKMDFTNLFGNNVAFFKNFRKEDLVPSNSFAGIYSSLKPMPAGHPAQPRGMFGTGAIAGPSGLDGWRRMGQIGRSVLASTVVSGSQTIQAKLAKMNWAKASHVAMRSLRAVPGVLARGPGALSPVAAGALGLAGPVGFGIGMGYAVVQTQYNHYEYGKQRAEYTGEAAYSSWTQEARNRQYAPVQKIMEDYDTKINKQISLAEPLLTTGLTKYMSEKFGLAIGKTGPEWSKEMLGYSRGAMTAALSITQDPAAAAAYLENLRKNPEWQKQVETMAGRYIQDMRGQSGFAGDPTRMGTWARAGRQMKDAFLMPFKMIGKAIQGKPAREATFETDAWWEANDPFGYAVEHTPELADGAVRLMDKKHLQEVAEGFYKNQQQKEDKAEFQMKDMTRSYTRVLELRKTEWLFNQMFPKLAVPMGEYWQPQAAT